MVPAVGYAQETPDLVVSLRDERGAGVAAEIVVRDVASRVEFARARADAEGSAAIAGLPVNEVRVAVEGALPDGTALVQRGDDARGVRLLLDAGLTRLDLRVDPDGAVLPDPATMIEPEGIALDHAAVPTAAVAAPVVDAPASRPTSAPRPSPAMPRPVDSAPQSPASGASGLLIVTLLGGAIAGVLVIRRRI